MNLIWKYFLKLTVILAVIFCLVGCGADVTEKEAFPTETAEITSEPQAIAVTKDNTKEIEENSAEEKTETIEKNEDIEEKLTCTLSVKCDTILNIKEELSLEKAEFIPPDGVILAEKEVNFTSGESVFDVLAREMRNSGIHFEFVKTPIYDSAYIEGIANIYEFDCGELSGWMYRVNGVFPKGASSGCLVKSGDKIEWIYTCDLGEDIGGNNY